MMTFITLIAVFTLFFYIYMDMSYERNIYSIKLTVPQSKILYYGLQFTWGLLQNLAGAVVLLYLFCMAPHLKPCMAGRNVKVKTNYSANFSLGVFVFVNCDTESILQHECGHSLQNMYYGPFAILCVAFPSLVRYWYRCITHINNYNSYFDIWFEYQASISGVTK